jgi:hypothetical protein
MRHPGLRRQSLLALTMLAAASLVIASDKGKGYPVQGKIMATALNQVPRQQTSTGPNGAVYSSRVIVVTRTYTVQTQDKTYVLDCGKHPHLFSSTPG